MQNQEILQILSQRIRSYRLAARMSQNELAEASGVSCGTISRFEQGRNYNLTINNLVSILQVLGRAEQLLEVLPELPLPPLALNMIEKIIPKRKRTRK